jgi:hypothetical protein
MIGELNIRSFDKPLLLIFVKGFITLSHHSYANKFNGGKKLNGTIKSTY